MLRELEEAVQRQFQVSDTAATTTTGVAKDWESRLHISQVRTISNIMSSGVVYSYCVILSLVLICRRCTCDMAAGTAWDTVPI